MPRLLVTTLVVLAATAAAAGHLAPRRPGADPAAETARIERRLEQMEARLLRDDPEVRRLNQALGAEMLAAMEAAEPGITARATRLDELRAQPSPTDVEGAVEMLRLRSDVDRAVAGALREPRLAAMVQLFNATVRERMLHRYPEARRLLQRYAELHGQDAAPGAP